MTKKNKIVLAIIVLLFTALVVLRHFIPKPIDWKLSFNGHRKTPYACSVIKDMMPYLFPGKELRENTSSFFITLPGDTIDEENLIIICNEFKPDAFDLDALLDFVSQGNNVFLAAIGFSEKLKDTLGFNTNTQVFDTTLFRKVNERLNLYCTNDNSDSLFAFRKKMPESFLTAYDTLNTTPLGCDRNGNADFIVMPFGRGNVYIHTQPLAFTNYHILYGNHQYACTALSHLPVVNTIWDQYYKPDKVYDLSPVRYILSQPALKTAYLLLMVTILIYMIFGSKRLQKPLPVALPVKNNSLEFVITVGKLYYRSNNHTDLARKKVTYFNEFIHNRYYITKDNDKEKEIRTLSMRSGVDEEMIRELMKITAGVSLKREISQQELIQIHRSIEEFYKNCK